MNSVYSDGGRPLRESQKICRFINTVFKEVDAEGPCRAYYFKVPYHLPRAHTAPSSRLALPLIISKSQSVRNKAEKNLRTQRSSPSWYATPCPFPSFFTSI